MHFGFDWKGTSEIEGMFIDMSKLIELHLELDPKSFSNMHNMRFLKIYDSDNEAKESKLRLPNDLHSLPNSLIYFHWLGYPCKYLPSNFVARNLVELDMRHSNLERLWDGVQVNICSIINCGSTKLRRSFSNHLTFFFPS